MTDERQAEAEAKSAEAIQAQAVAAESIEKARIAQLLAAMEARDSQTQRILVNALHEVFNENKSERFIDTGRIPFICDDIKKISSNLNEINDNKVTKTDFLLLKQQSDLTNKIVLGAIAIILTTFLGGLTFLVFK